MSSRFDWERALRKADVPATRKLVLLTLSSFANKNGEARPSQEKIAEASGLSVRAVGGHVREALNEGWLVRTRKGRGAGENRRKALASEYLLTIPVPTDNRHHVPVDSDDNRHDVPAESGSQPAPERVVNRHEVPTFSTRNIPPSHLPSVETVNTPADNAERARQIQQMLRNRQQEKRGGPFDDDTGLATPDLGGFLKKWEAS